MATLDKSIEIAYDFIKKWEGKPKKNADGNYVAFNDGYGNATIGWGATYYQNGTPVKMGDIITPSAGDQLFEYHVREHASGVAEYINLSKYNDNQFAAMISFAYTTGVGAFEDSRLLNAIENNIRGNELRSVWISSYVTSNGIFSKGLENRRKDEYTLFNSEYNEVYSFYLRNEENINKAGIFVIAGISVAMAVYLYFVLKKKQQ